jgi:hypothetical protein
MLFHGFDRWNKKLLPSEFIRKIERAALFLSPPQLKLLPPLNWTLYFTAAPLM